MDLPPRIRVDHGPRSMIDGGLRVRLPPLREGRLGGNADRRVAGARMIRPPRLIGCTEPGISLSPTSTPLPLPWPIWPSLLLPQHRTCPAELTAQVCRPPAVTARRLSPARSTGPMSAAPGCTRTRRRGRRSGRCHRCPSSAGRRTRPAGRRCDPSHRSPGARRCRPGRRGRRWPSWAPRRRRCRRCGPSRWRRRNRRPSTAARRCPAARTCAPRPR